ncbi:hypothetical protein Y032_0065g3678 [Ancylostoma ceylanicum]|uniref:G-protein coupled receptors family 1 profile domain-containing protein n=1 Tax=Ancylostoma ceylanicum TaxID=53326 RepID=A0A016U0Q3_9BILA|nr:hypothetical protein Y032_0065g3678 [Ancylostoma ceylanicum]
MGFNEAFAFLNFSQKSEECIYVTLCCIQMVEHLTGIFISFWFLCIICKSSVFHVNLTWILSSLTFSLCLTSATKLICNGFIVSRGKYDFATAGVVEMTWEMCILSVCINMVLLSVERLAATVRSTTYEHESNLIIICTVIIFMWTSLSILTCVLYHFKGLDGPNPTTDQSIAFACIICTSVAIVITSLVHRHNFRNWKKRRCLMRFSECYQVRENIKTSRIINHIFISFSILFTIGVAFYAFYLLVSINGLYLLFGFVFDIVTCSPSIVIPLIVIFAEERLNRRVAQQLQKYVQNKINAAPPVTLKDLEGKTINIAKELHPQTYFQQLDQAWR